jgi:hypothetical protein
VRAGGLESETVETAADVVHEFSARRAGKIRQAVLGTNEDRRDHLYSDRQRLGQLRAPLRHAEAIWGEGSDVPSPGSSCNS